MKYKQNLEEYQSLRIHLTLSCCYLYKWQIVISKINHIAISRKSKLCYRLPCIMGQTIRFYSLQTPNNICTTNLIWYMYFNWEEHSSSKYLQQPLSTGTNISSLPICQRLMKCHFHYNNILLLLYYNSGFSYIFFVVNTLHILYMGQLKCNNLVHTKNIYLIIIKP